MDCHHIFRLYVFFLFRNLTGDMKLIVYFDTSLILADPCSSGDGFTRLCRLSNLSEQLIKTKTNLIVLRQSCSGHRWTYIGNFFVNCGKTRHYPYHNVERLQNKRLFLQKPIYSYLNVWTPRNGYGTRGLISLTSMHSSRMRSTHLLTTSCSNVHILGEGSVS